jgi:hypothetical protein
MPQDPASAAVPDTRPIYRLIRRTRLLLRSSWVLTGVGLTLGLLLGTLATATLLDTLVPISPEINLTPERGLLPYLWLPGWVLRLLALLLVVIPAAGMLLVGVLRPLLRRLAPVQVARRIESHLPGIHNRLVSCLDLGASEQKRQQSPAFYRRLLQEALDRIRGFRARVVVDFPALRRAVLFAAVTVLGFGLAWLLLSDRLAVACARIFDPFSDIPPRSGVAYEVTPADARVLRGEDIPFAVRVTEGAPDTLWLELRSPASGERLRYPLERQKQDPGLWLFTLGSTNIAPGFANAFAYRVRGGGTWSRQYHITMVDRPRIVGQHTVLHYPPYLGLEPRVGPPDTLDVTGPEGGQVEVVVRAEGQVSEGAVQLLGYQQPGPGVKDRPERVWVDDRVPAGAVADGTWTWDSDTHQRPAHTEPPAPGLHGHWFQGAAEPFTVGADDNLFVYAYLVPGHRPDALVLEWSDGTSWEHRAYWGGEVRLGKPNSPGRRWIGPLPEAGQWVRLEVPAALVDLHGKNLRGMSFKTLGGQCYWGRAGALPPVLGVKDSYPMLPGDDGEWAGRFPLQGTGLYRVELRNELGHANKAMKEAKFVALPDQPPQVVLEQPGADLVLSQPEDVALVVRASDDYGLRDVSIATQRDGESDWSSQTIKRYEQPTRGDHFRWALDLKGLGLKVGQTLRYRVEARDRKGQSAQTPEHLIRIAADANADDQQLANFEKGQDPFREKLARLLAEQAKVREAVEKADAKYAPLLEKIKAPEADTRPATKDKPPTQSKPPEPDMASLKLDQEAAKKLQELQKEMAELAQKEQQNVQLGQQVAGDLAQTAEQMSRLKMMPQALTRQMQAVQQLFQQKAVPSLEDLAGRMAKGADSKQPAPDLKEMKERSNRLQKELEALQERLKALADARAKMRGNLDEALKQLERDMLRQDSALTADELKELRDYLARLQEEMKRFGGRQEKVHEETEKAADKDLPAEEKKQAPLDRQFEDLAKQLKKLLDSDKARRMKRRPNFPDEPYTPDQGEEKVRPREEDTDDPAADRKDPKGGDKADKKDNKKDDDDEDPTYAPALGGPKPKVDPRFAKKMRPLPKRSKDDKGDPNDPAGRRDELEGRQEQHLRDADQAQKSLASDQQSLERLLRQLAQASRPGGRPSGQGQEMDSETARQLGELMRSPALQQAMAMLARARQAQASARQSGPRTPTPGQTSTGNLQGSPVNANLDAELATLDPAARNLILKMPPRVREELLQGMREEGPEGYRKFIDEYFKRLTEVKGPK